MEYFEVVLLIAITSWIIKPNEKCNESKKFFSIIAAAILILFCSCRKFTVGYDGASYLMKFRQIANAGWVDILSKAPFGKIYQVEFGYAFLNKVISVTVSDYQWVIAICSTITVINFMIFIYKNSKHLLFSTILLICEGTLISTFTLQRQAVALSFVLVAWSFWNEGKKRKSILFCICAMMFHQSAIVCVLLIFLSRFSPRKRTFWLLIGGGVAVSVGYPFVIRIAAKIFPHLMSYVNGNFYELDIGGVIVLWIIEISVCVILICTRNFGFCSKTVKEKIGVKAEFYSCVFTCYYILFYLLATQYDLAERIGLYFRPFVLILIPAISDRVDKKYKPFIDSALILGFCFFLYLQTQGVYSYTVFWK